MSTAPAPPARPHYARVLVFGLGLSLVLYFVAYRQRGRSDAPAAPPGATAPAETLDRYRPRDPTIDMSGYATVQRYMRPWSATASLEEVGAAFAGAAGEMLKRTEEQLSDPLLPVNERIRYSVIRAAVLNHEGRPGEAYKVLAEARTAAAAAPAAAEQWLYTVIYCQGVTALRRGETENCVLCRGESSCILPIPPAAVHTNTAGSRAAVGHFTEYLKQFPDDVLCRWLLNIAHMTLGEYPGRVDPRHRLDLSRYLHSEFDIGRFRDVGHLVGVDRLNQYGGGIMDDFDGDGLLDIVVTANNLTQPMGFFRNKGDGTFEDRTEAAGLSGQFGGLYCLQGDFDNDGFLDIFIPRGAWVSHPVRSSLLRNNGNGTFADVTKAAGLDAGVNALTACCAHYDNDGLLDIFVPCSRQPNRLYRNKGDGTFEEVAARAGVAGNDAGPGQWKSACWVDFDRDGYPDLFVNRMRGTATLYRNNRDGTFADVTAAVGIDGPRVGFSCWGWDYDNDGWPDIFAACYDYPIEGVVSGLVGEPHTCLSNRLYHNRGGKGFQDVTRDVGLDLVFGTMGSNFGDFDNDGFLDVYLGTGGPDLAALMPNRMFKNVAGRRFAEITGSSGTGHLQKGHSVACGDWDRNGTLDIFIQMGGATPGDRYHNILFQNPGTANRSLTVKLVGKKTNRSAIGARIKAATAGDRPRTVYRWVSSGSSFGGNPLEQTIGLGAADRVAELEVYWPTSGTTQTFRDIPAGRYLEITEFAADYRTREFRPVPLPK